MPMIALRLPALALLLVAACSRANPDDEAPVAATLATAAPLSAGHPNGYPRHCRSYTAAIVGTLNLLLVVLVRPSQAIDQLRLESPCRGSGDHD